MKLFVLSGLILSCAIANAQSDALWARVREGNLLESQLRQVANPRVAWSSDGKSYASELNGKMVWRDIQSNAEVPAPQQVRVAPSALQSLNGRKCVSADGIHHLVSDGGNITLEHIPTGAKTAVTTDGNAAAQVRNGSLPWVVQEELSQEVSMAWAPRGDRFWFFRFDGSQVKPFYLLGRQAGIQNTLEVLDYPKAGEANHLVSLWVGKPGEAPKRIASLPSNDFEYLWDVRWLDADRLIYQRSDRRHKKKEVVLWSVPDAKETILHTEAEPTGYVSWTFAPIVNGEWVYVPAAREGFVNWKRIRTRDGRAEWLTQHGFDVENQGLLHVSAQAMLYRARGGNHPLATQLYRYDFRTRTSVRLTDPSMHHRLSVSPDGQTVAVFPQKPGIAPEPVLLRPNARGATVLRKLPARPLPILPAPAVELFEFPAADPRVTLSGTIHFPRGFDPAKRYPVLMPVYAGPEQTDVDLNFAPYRALTELGFLIVQAETRGGLGRGTAFRHAMYQNLGITEVDDLAACVAALGRRAYVDSSRVGIFGTSYGGYAALMALLRYPDRFAAASASSPPTDWRHYDTIYTERYMGLPQEAAEAYARANPIPLAKNLKGQVQLYFGTKDENVHPNSSLMLIQEFNRLDRDITVVVGPDRGHTFVGERPMMRFFFRAFGMN